ncbi:MAG: surface-adhesin E family protein [Nitrospirota bacterium]
MRKKLLPLAYVSGFWSLITLLVLSSGSVYAEWVAIEKDYLSPGLQTLYVDPDTIRREGNLVTLWQLIDFKWMQGSARGPARFLSTKTHKQFDCAEKRVRLLAFTEFSRQMGTGIPVDGYIDRGNWLPVEPDSMNHALWEVACGNRGNPAGSMFDLTPRSLAVSESGLGLVRERDSIFSPE